MNVFLVRHAHSVNEQPGLPDLARHLTAEGRAAARQLGDRLRWHDCVPTVVWTSPATRAVQTAELLIAGLAWDGPVEALPDLAPGGDVRGVAARVHELAPDAVVLVVGHEPGISGLGAVLTGRPDFPALRKAQAVRLDDEPGRMTLRWRFAYSDDAPASG